MILKLIGCLGLLGAISFGSPHSVVLSFHAGADCTVQTGKAPCENAGVAACTKKIVKCIDGNIDALSCVDGGGTVSNTCVLDLECQSGTHALRDKNCTPVVDIHEDGPIGP
jgi:hypothetical protein